MTLTLHPHPDHLPENIRSVEASVMALGPHWLCLRWKVEGTQTLVVPPFAGKGRADNLWQTTCFEMFVKPEGGEGYTEFNLSPSERWAAYDFSGYRSGMENRAMTRQPDCTIRRGGSIAIFDASIPVADLPALPWRAGLSAVLEEQGGRKSYWALNHPDGKADFHDPTCFALSLGPREAA